jgi:hypothetical protein
MVKGKFIMDVDDAHTINHKAGDTVSQWIAPPYKLILMVPSELLEM